MLCHSVRSCHWPSLSLKRSLVANENLATGIPPWVYFTSGSLPRFPIRITLLTLFPAMMNAAPSAPGETRNRRNQGLEAQYIRNEEGFDRRGRKECKASAKPVQNETIATTAFRRSRDQRDVRVFCRGCKSCSLRYNRCHGS